ncbi:hypothetical protein [Aquimarina litoralis]|uniref:hypothetical protein n=1 Tax=Aquimarina litoralis TaxID=584605 RepID=UPI001C58F6C8|nr:hypothetical protein [Aquimarina litoralis]MBW1297552.1 hypothetical protein [Aquimarina litoralis]
MMKYVLCKQERALKGKILVIIVFVFSAAMLVFSKEELFSRILLFVVSFLFLGFSISYRIDKTFENHKVFSVFGLVFYKQKLDLEFPDYISVFAGSFSQNNEWSTVSALGTKERHEGYVVRFFKENRRETLFKTNKYDIALKKAEDLSKLLNVEIYNATKS